MFLEERDSTADFNHTQSSPSHNGGPVCVLTPRKRTLPHEKNLVFEKHMLTYLLPLSFARHGRSRRLQ